MKKVQNLKFSKKIHGKWMFTNIFINKNETISTFWIKNNFEMPELKKITIICKCLKKNLGLNSDVKKYIETISIILNKKYFWNAKVEIKITILFKC